jgi:hypothetical protein
MATNTSKKSQSTESAKPPVAKLRIGLINATIWERVTENGKFHSVTFERRYRDGNGELALDAQLRRKRPAHAGEARRPGSHRDQPSDRTHP